ncbi:MAG: Mur ligase family protein [Clostridia bacterium]
MFKTIEEASNYIYKSYVDTYQKINRELSDEFTRKNYLCLDLLEETGRPDIDQHNILVTGSKGKGSISIILAKILEGQGYKIGLFTSPHLIKYNERIRVNGIAISDEDLLSLINKLEPYISAKMQKLKEDEYLGPVGLTAIIAMHYFLQQKTDFNIVECGRGARFDDVNVITSEWAMLNTVFLEHSPALGNKITEVAWHKAGILKSGVKSCVTALQNANVVNILEEESNKNGVKLCKPELDYFCHNIAVSRNGTSFDFKNSEIFISALQINLLGRHQAYNTALAVQMAFEILKEKLDIAFLRESLRNIVWHGRLEIIQRKPLTILDACIHKDCIIYVKEIVSLYAPEKVYVVIGIPEDKDFVGVIEAFNGFAEKLYVTYAINDYLKFSEEQFTKARTVFQGETVFISQIELCLTEAKHAAESNGAMLIIIGTQSLLKDVKLFYKQTTLNI